MIGEYKGAGFKEPVYLVRRADGQVIQCSRLLYLIAAEADGQKDFGQIALWVSRKFGRNLSAHSIRFLVENKLQPTGVLAPTDGGDPKLKRAKPPLALKFRVPILPERLVRAIAGVLWPLFLPPVVIVMLGGLVALYFWMFFIHGMTQSIQETLYQPEFFLMLAGITYFSGLFHEFGHATACRYGGAKPSRIGVGIYIVWPVFYNDVTDTYRLSRGGRLRTDLGGIYFNIVYSLALAGAYFFSGLEMLLLAIILQQFIILEQFTPFIRLDGYYVVSDLTGVPDLFAYIGPILKSMIPGREADRRVRELKPWVRVVVSIWVAITIPTLLYVFMIIGISAPLVFTTVWDYFFIYYAGLWDAFADGRVAEGIEGLLQIMLLVLPAAAIALVFTMLGKSLGIVAWRLSAGKHALRFGLIMIATVLAASVALFNGWFSRAASIFPGGEQVVNEAVSWAFDNGLVFMLFSVELAILVGLLVRSLLVKNIHLFERAAEKANAPAGQANENEDALLAAVALVYLTLHLERANEDFPNLTRAASGPDTPNEGAPEHTLFQRANEEILKPLSQILLGETAPPPTTGTLLSRFNINRAGDYPLSLGGYLR